jgi:hypothetical protein
MPPAPPASTRSSQPKATFWAAMLTASSPEAQKRFSWRVVVQFGNRARHRPPLLWRRFPRHSTSCPSGTKSQMLSPGLRCQRYLSGRLSINRVSPGRSRSDRAGHRRGIRLGEDLRRRVRGAREKRELSPGNPRQQVATGADRLDFVVNPLGGPSILGIGDHRAEVFLHVLQQPWTLLPRRHP